ncbi:hypothetical protein FJZ33_11655, partial [Candidatus Poribacteria bacterium]|nr:hypothetical protein [Candidatus Poribacteria bacterium]
MSKEQRIPHINRFQDQQYTQIISRSSSEIQDVLQSLGLLVLSSRNLPYSHKMSAQVALGQKPSDLFFNLLPQDLSKFKERDLIVAHYAQPHIQQEMYRYAKGRFLTVLRSFKQPMFSELRQPEDILALMFHYLRNNRWPSLHATIFRRNQAGERVCDFVFEPDFKKNWAVAFGAARPIVQLFTKMGLPFFIKFSGHSSPHIIVPGEVLAISGKHEIKKQEFRMQVYRFVQSHMDNPGLLDGHSWNPTHFLRLPYSIHELGGKVSVPIRPEEFDSFNPDKARIENVKVIENWWDIPDDAVQRGREFIQQVTNIYPRLVSGIDKRELGHKWKPPDVPRKLRKFMDGNWYGKVTANGKQILASTAMPTANDLTARRILKNPSSKAIINALELLNRWKNAGMEIDLKAASDVFEVNPLELQIRWQAQFTEQKIHPAYRYLYYSRTEIQEAFFHYVQGRCFSTKDGYFRIQQPSDIPLLAAYFDLNTKSRGFQCTKAIYRESDNQIAG